MPKQTGVEFLAEAVGAYPDVKRALLIAYADTEAAIKAINEIRLDYYLMKPSLVSLPPVTRARSVKRVASAVGEGSITAQFVHQHLASL